MVQTDVHRARWAAAAAAAAAVVVAAALAAAAVPSAHATPRARRSTTTVNECWSTDNGDPQLDSFVYSPTRVGVVNGEGHVTLTAAAHDTGGPGAPAGVSGVLVWFGKGVGDEEFGLEGQELSKQPDGSWATTVTVPRRTPQSVWRIGGAIVRDAAGNRRSYSRADLQALTGRSMDVAITTEKDPTKPRLKYFNVSPSSVDTRTAPGLVTFTAKVVDREADLVDGVVVDGRGDTEWLAPEYGSLTLDVVPGHRFLYQAQVPVSMWLGSRRWHTTDVWAWSSANRSFLVRGDVLRARGFATDFTVQSAADDQRPVAQSFAVEPTTVDVTTSDASASFTVHATDVGSGVKEVYPNLLFLENLGQKFSGLHLTSGSPNDGTWTGTWTFDHCRAQSSSWKVELTLYDRNANYEDSTFYSTRDLADAGFPSRLHTVAGDHERPRVTVPSPVARRGPVRGVFNEDVVGISATEAVVHRKRANGSLGPAVIGTWACRNAAGTTVDCAAGPVHEARFQPSTRLAGGAKYVVALNPEHHLGVLDIAGNPLRRTRQTFNVAP